MDRLTLATRLAMAELEYRRAQAALNGTALATARYAAAWAQLHEAQALAERALRESAPGGTGTGRAER